METWDALTARRQVREYTDDPVDEDALRRVLEAGRRSPSARNLQRWDLVVVRGAEARSDLARTWQGAGFVAGAPVVIAVVAPVVEEEMRMSVEYDLGQMVTAVLVAATDLGLATGQSSCRDQDLARSILGFPEDRSAPTCSRSATPPIARSLHSASRPGGPSTRSSTGTAGEVTRDCQRLRASLERRLSCSPKMTTRTQDVVSTSHQYGGGQ